MLLRLPLPQLVAVHADYDDGGFENYVGYDDEVVDYYYYYYYYYCCYDASAVDGDGGGVLVVCVLVNCESSNVELPIQLLYDCAYFVGDDSLTGLGGHDEAVVVDVVAEVAAVDDVETVHGHWQGLRPRYEHQQHYGVLLVSCAAPENVTMDSDDIFVAFLV